MIVLAFETSCDETSAAVVRNGREILANVIHSQQVHHRFGGVVPELAGREHIKKIIPIMRQALVEAEMDLTQAEAFAATFGPGLAGALLVGLSLAKTLAFALDRPFYAVNHLEGHIAANLLAHPDLEDNFLTLLASGGHTLLVDVNGFGRYTVLGHTLDDAAGEAFDKVAKLLGLGYPGGAAVDQVATTGNPAYLHFPRALPDPRQLDFSYSGLKTAVALHVRSLSPGQLEKHRADIAASFQEAAVDMLCTKTGLALEKTKKKVLTVSGGVAANSRLRRKMQIECDQRGVRLVFPPPDLCTDNAAMIAAAACFHLIRGERSSLEANALACQKLA